MKNLWKVAALVALAAIPLILLGRKKVDEKTVVPQAGDDSNIFERELTVD